MKKSNPPDCCPLCQRVTHLSFHHFIPRKVHRRAYYRKNVAKSTLQQGVYICRQCHNGIHKAYDEMSLAKQFTSLEKLRADPQLANHFAWVSKQRVQPLK